MRQVFSDDAQIVYESFGAGALVILLHPFPTHHEFWVPAAQTLLTRYTVIIPDLRGHGDSGLGEGPATMQKHANDIARVMDDAGISRAVVAGNSIGGYVAFEFWRQHRDRISGLVFCNTKAQADTPAGRAARLQSADEVLEQGTEPFFASQILRWMGETARASRPDLVDAALKMMRKMSPYNLAMVQRGMADRPDSVPTLNTINVPALIISGTEDHLTGVADAELMHQHIAGSSLKILPKAGHYSPWEQPEEVGRLLRQFVDGIPA
jgi:pimeloyl-ACP methyl ester carboxylesterase